MARNEFAKMPPERVREVGRKGGIASGEAKRRKKAMREILEVLLEMPLNDNKCHDVEDIKAFGKLRDKNVSVQTAMMIKQVQKALKGDLAAAEFIRDTSGQKPKDNVNIGGALPVVISGDDELQD